MSPGIKRRDCRRDTADCSEGLARGSAIATVIEGEVHVSIKRARWSTGFDIHFVVLDADEVGSVPGQIWRRNVVIIDEHHYPSGVELIAGRRLAVWFLVLLRALAT